MKICIINNLYPPYAVGGAERYVEEQVHSLQTERKEVTVITARPWAGWRQIFPIGAKDGETTIYRVWQPNIFWYKDLAKHNFFSKLIWHFLDIFNFFSAYFIRQILEKEKPDEVWTHNLMGVGVYQVRKVLKNVKSNVKWVHHLHDVQLVEPSGVLPWNHEADSIGQKIYSLIIQRRLGNPDTVVALSHFIEDFYFSRGFFPGAKWDTVTISNFQFPISKKIPNSNIKFLFIGSLVEHKGIRVLMQAWDLLCHSREGGNLIVDRDLCFPARNAKHSVAGGRRDDRGFVLNIVGDGVLRVEVEEWSKNFNNVNVYGRLEGEELKKIYQTCNILVFPSVCLENRPKVILEALANGLSIIASDTGGVRELVAPNENAWLFEPGNISELVKRIKRFI